MTLDWQNMAVMEPDWYSADHPQGAVDLMMTWDEDEWLVCRGEDVMHHTGTADIEEAKRRAETWLEQQSK